MKSITFTAKELVSRAEEKFQNEKNTFCYHDFDASLDDAMYEMKQELAELQKEVERELGVLAVEATIQGFEELKRRVE